jgi:hypothetical protein
VVRPHDYHSLHHGRHIRHAPQLASALGKQRSRPTRRSPLPLLTGCRSRPCRSISSATAFRSSRSASSACWRRSDGSTWPGGLAVFRCSVFQYQCRLYTVEMDPVHGADARIRRPLYCRLCKSSMLDAISFGRLVAQNAMSIPKLACRGTSRLGLASAFFQDGPIGTDGRTTRPQPYDIEDRSRRPGSAKRPKATARSARSALAPAHGGK